MGEAKAVDITRLLHEVRAGKPGSADQLMSAVYTQMHRLAGNFMRAEKRDHTLQATALVNEAYLRMFEGQAVDMKDRGHFFAIAARQMRNALVDHARRKRSAKRGSGVATLELQGFDSPAPSRLEDIVAIDELLTQLERLDARAARVVELRFFGGLTDREVCETLSVPMATVRRDWEFARAWLFRHLTRGTAAGA